MAFVLECLDSTTLGTRVPVGVVLLLSAVLVVWCIRTSWKDGFDEGKGHLLAWCTHPWNSFRALFSSREPQEHEQKESVDTGAYDNNNSNEAQQEASRESSPPVGISVRQATVLVDQGGQIDEEQGEEMQEV